MSFQKKFVNLVRPRISHSEKVQFPFGNVPLVIFAEALKSSKVLSHLELTNVDHPELLEDALTHMKSLKYMSIIYSDFPPIDNDLYVVRGHKIALMIANVLKVNKLIGSLIILRACIFEEEALVIADGLKVNIALTFLDLSGNYIEDAGAIAIINAIRSKTTITTLNLNDNNIGDRGAIAIAEVLKVNTSIIKLGLALNEIGNDGAIAIADALTVNTTLTKLYLSNNEIRPKGGVAIGDSLKVNSSLLSLYLDDNCIRNRGALAIAEALVLPCTSLQELSLNHNKIQGYGVAVLFKALEYNCNLKKIHILSDELDADGYLRTESDCVNPVVYPMKRYGMSAGPSFCPTLQEISFGRHMYEVCDGKVNTKALIQKLLERLVCEDGAHVLSHDYWIRSLHFSWVYDSY